VNASWMIGLALVASFVGGCGDSGGTTTGSSSSSSGAGGNVPAFDACPMQHTIAGDAGEVIVCDQAFAAAPFVHLPEATSALDYMALRACSSFVDRDGNAHAPKAGLAVCDDPATGEGNAEMLGHAFAIYETSLDASGAVTSFRRWAVVDEKNLLAPLAGATLEGKVSKANGDGTFALDPTLPVRVTMPAPALNMTNADGTSVYEIDGAIDNLTSGVVSAGGPCLPSLASDGGNPFAGATSVVLAFTRVPSMHGPGDDEAVFDIRVDGGSKGSCMSAAWYVSPADLIAATGPELTTYDGFGHGTPGSIPNVKLDIVKGGGAACSP
jgi:hypothetical protein